MMIGSVPLWSVAVGLALAACAAVAVCAASLSDGRRLPVHPLAFVLLGLLAFQALQLVPLPPSLVAWLSPRAAEIFDFVLQDLGGWPAWRPLSLDPIQGGVELARLSSWVLLLLATTALARRAGTAKLIRWLALSAVAVVTLAVAHGLLGAERIFWVYPATPGGGRLFGPFVNPNHMAAFLDLMAPICLGMALSSRRRQAAALWGVAFVLVAATCLLTLSRGGVVGLVVGLVVFFALRFRTERAFDAVRPASNPDEDAGGGSPDSGRAPSRRRRRALLRSMAGPFLVAASAMVGAYVALGPILGRLATFSSHGRLTDDVRWSIWSGALSMIRDFWAVGSGRGSFLVTYPLYKEVSLHLSFSHAENQLVQMAAELGLVVSLAVISSLAAVWLILAAGRRWSVPEIGVLAGLSGLAAHELTDFATSFGGVAVPAAVGFACLLGAAGRKKSRPGLLAPRRISPAVALVAVLVVSCVGTAVIARALGEGPDDALARVSLSLEEGIDAEDAARGALLRRPTDYMVPLVAANAALELDGPASALPWLNKALYLSPGDFRVHLLAADVLGRAGRREQALLHYRSAVERGAPVRRVLAVAAARYPELRSLATVVPDSERGLLELTRFLVGRGRHADAWEMGSRLSAQDEPGPDLLLLLARAAVSSGRHSDGERVAREVAEADPRDPRPHRLIGSARIAAGDLEGAVAALDYGLAHSPGDPDLSMALARLHLHRRSDAPAALEVLDAMRPARDPARRSRMHLLRAEAHRRLGHTRQALAELETASRLAPGDSAPWLAKGDHFMATSQWGRALDAYEQARRRDPAAAVDARINRATERLRALEELREAD